MTLGYLMFTLGGMFLYSAVTNTPIRNLILGLPGPGQPASILGDGKAGATLTKLTGGGGVGTFDNHKVCKRFVPILQRARREGWSGQVTSGVRTRAESVAACRRICGQDQCPGTCAGTDSNHNGCSPGAVDVSDPEGFTRAMARQGNPLKNDLPDDPVHFSPTGH